ncbi:MAG: ATP-binding cassette domain-containing protein [Oligoflexia bacterium]|nr:ATP-binding cassette domain-containing protein [Oligoflexia bacterium]
MSTSGQIETLLNPQTAIAKSLMPLLDAVGWKGEISTLIEALPEDADHLNLFNLQRTLFRLNFSSTIHGASLNKVNENLLPVLFIGKHDEAMVLIRRIGKTMLIYHGKSGLYQQIPLKSLKGKILVLNRIDSKTKLNLQLPQSDWSLKLFKKNGKYFSAALGLTFIVSILALIPPLLITALYNGISLRSSTETMLYLGIGVAIYLTAYLGLKILRSLLMSELGIKIGINVSYQVFRRILYLPPSYTEMASLSSQISRIKDFDSVREFLAGPLFASLLEIPFLIIMITALFMVDVSMALIALFSIFLFILLGIMVIPVIKRTNTSLADTGKNLTDYILETLTHIRDIKFSGSLDSWHERHRQFSAESSLYSYRSANIDSTVSTISSGIVSLAGLGTMTIGVLSVIEHKMAPSVLIAVMFLVWRILAPIRTIFNIATQIGRTKRSIEQLDRFMGMPQEVVQESAMIISRELNGNIKFQNVSIRYTSDAIPALLNASFSIDAGNFTTISGHGASGKSTIIKMIMGLYTPQVGRVLLDNLNIRQLEPLKIRKAIAYLPQQISLFKGTIESNLRLANPTATTEEIELSCQESGLDLLLKNLPLRLQTPIEISTTHYINYELSKLIGITRVFLRRSNSNIILMDEPFTFLTNDIEKIVMNSLKKLKGRATIIVTAFQNKIPQISDQIIYLDQGKVQKIEFNEVHQ